MKIVALIVSIILIIALSIFIVWNIVSIIKALVQKKKSKPTKDSEVNNININ